MTYEELQLEHDYLNIKELNLSEISGLKGLYVDGNIAIQEGLTSVDKSCVLAEELGHHYTSTGNILNMKDTRCRKQERKARLWAYNKKIGLSGIIRAYDHRCLSKSETAEYLNVTEDFLLEALQCYTEIYGAHVEVDNFIIFFQPALAVMENFSIK